MQIILEVAIFYSIVLKWTIRSSTFLAGYLQSHALDSAMGVPAPCARAGTFGYWMHPAGEDLTGYLQPCWLAAY